MTGPSTPGRPALPAALTMGEPAGIGPDITLSTWAGRAGNGVGPFFVLGDGRVMAERAKLLGLEVPIREIGAPEETLAHFAGALPVLPVPCPEVVPGEPRGETAAAVIRAIEEAVALTLAGRASAVVTNPIAKSVLARAGFPHPGHTEFLAELSGRGGVAPQPVMMLAAPVLRAVPVTTHIALRDVPGALTRELIVRIARITVDGLIRHFAVARPRLLFAGLNPHAGEDGLMGHEDEEIVRPAVSELAGEGIDARGPVSADTMFHAEARATYDAAICMYHDQALIPVKTLAFDEAVNVTLGLAFLRTSPDHGTAFALAGTGRAREASLLAALALAAGQASGASGAARALG